MPEGNNITPLNVADGLAEIQITSAGNPSKIGYSYKSRRHRQHHSFRRGPRSRLAVCIYVSGSFPQKVFLEN